ncbi:KR domain-containing protein [Parashewanella curva]|uniref:KR domain-containing protein n=1 Tax=Parashewanella curva TaxID=2338552 RepID=A0A3L8PVP5_9GAMM|nr:type I polyketide synthase [Parashewanella curva]RLV59406.1 KR domain-containing protein [Parashewanella curva]
MSQTSTHDQQQDKRLNRRLKDTPIAIVGMASIFADSRYLDEFWDLISDKVNAISDVPDTHWNADDYFDSNKSTPDKIYCKRGGFMPEVDFNPMEFGLPPNILELTDSSQLLSLVVAKEVLADAKLGEDYDRDRIGITLGIGGGQQISQSMNARLQYPVLRKVFKNSGISDEDAEMLIQKVQDQYVPWEENSFPGSLGNVIAGRIANRFNLGGMNCVVDAACAGSHAAIRMAVTELVEGRSDMMITGGVCTDNSPYMYMSFSKTPAFTDQETIKPFDADSNGMMIGEGIGMIAIKRLEDAERDGDRIYAVIKGVGASSDGKFKSIYAPRSEGQAKALKRAYDDAGFEPKTVGLIEAHGTGTAAGDVAEFFGLSSVFSEDNDQKQHIALGSIKSQVGHTKSTAGTAGLIKMALAMHHKVLPPTISVEKPNPKLDIEDSPFYLNTETRPWLRVDDTPRRGGISSFGFGGTNFHIVLEEYDAEHARDNKYRQRTVASSLLFSAHSVDDLIDELLDIQSKEFSLPELAAKYPLKGIPSRRPRLGFVASSIEQAKQQIEQAIQQLKQKSDTPWTLPSGASYRPSALVNHKTMVAALFAGQGSQYVNMAKELACNFPEVRAEFDSANAVYAQNQLQRLSERVFPVPAFNSSDKKAQQAKLTDTAYAQTAIGAVSMAQFELLEQAGFTPDMVAGHSFGELSALRAAGVISSDDYYQLTFARGKAMASVPEGKDAGSMMAVILPTGSESELAQLQDCLAKFDDVKVANNNSSKQQVIAGGTESIEAIGPLLKEQGFKAIKLPVSGAFHTELVSHAQQPFAEAIQAAKFNAPQCDLYSNATGTLYEDDAETIQSEFQQHMLQSVRFQQQIKNMYQDGARVFVEFGPKDILQKLVTDNLANEEEEILTISINPNAKGDSDLQFRVAATQLAVAGIELENIDPYQAEKVRSEPAAGMSVKLCGHNYISEATKQKMQASLENGKIKSQIQYVDRPVEKIVEKIIEKPVIEKTFIEQLPESSVNKPKSKPTASQATPASGDTLDAFFAAQNQVAKLHQQFLEIPQQYGDTFAFLMAEQAKLASQGLAIPEALQRSMEMFHQHQSQTLQSHEQFMQLQASQNQAALAMLNGTQLQMSKQEIPSASSAVKQNVVQPSVKQSVEVTRQTAPVVAQTTAEAAVSLPPQTPTAVNQPQSTPVVEPISSGLNPEQVQSTMLSVVAEKTGYPTEMLDLGMDMEADLGIDSIKRVEILGTVQDQLPELRELSPEDLAECRTLGEIVTYMNSKLDSSASVNSAPVASTTTSSLNAEQVQLTMLSVVAEKTGYPTEMLDLGMDMEADLGIDSIKRVEILGTVQDQLPELPELSPEDLAECRTLGEIVTYMNSKLDSSAPVNTAPLTTTATSGLNAEQVQSTMLAVVADKTGYPTEMLELSMDMEADLGIDSIKRVEILGTVQDQLPELPELNPEDLAECRTLGEIVTYMNSKLISSAPVVEEQVVSTSSTLNAEQVQSTMLAVVADKTGYPTEMLELSMDMEADLGIDSIKRVEILGTVQDQLPDLPELNPEDLAECRTLGEIVAYMNSKLTATAQPIEVVSQAPAANNESVNIELPPHSEVSLKKLPAAANPESVTTSGLFVITDDGQNAGILAEKLTAKGLTVAVVHAPETVLTAHSPLSSDIAQFTLSELNDTTIAETLASIQELGNINGFIHLQPKHEANLEINLDDCAYTHVEHAFLWAKHLQPILNTTEQGQFVTVSRMDGGFGYLNDSAFELNQAALSGLTKTLSHEWNKVNCKALDIDTNLDNAEFSSAIIAELFDQTQVTEIGISDSGRFTLVAGEQSQQSNAADINSSDKILVTGGAKGVTLECALKLAQATQGHFILAGRSQQIPHNELPAWAHGKSVNELKPAAISALMAEGKKQSPKQIDDLIWPIKSSLEIDHAIRRFEQLGASAEYLSLDVNNADAISETLAPLTAIAPITGLIHGAGVLADKLIQDKSLDELSRVYGTKVNGLKQLLDVLEPSNMKLIALFSSAAGFYGNTGQSDYAMANEILNKTAVQLSHNYPNCKSISFDWGPWDGGMVNSALKKMFTDRGVYVIPLEAGAQLFADKILSKSSSQLLIGSDMQGNSAHQEDAHSKKPNADVIKWDKEITLRLDPQNLGFIEHHQIKGHPVLPTVCALDWMLEQVENLTGKAWSVHHYQLLKGVVFDSDKTKVLTLRLEPQDEHLVATIECDGKPQYQAKLVEGAIAQPTIELSGITPYAQDANEFYRNGTLFHGEQLQGISQLSHYDHQGLIAKLDIPNSISSELNNGISNYHPVAEDQMLQALLVWTKLNTGHASLPVSIGEYQACSLEKTETITELRLKVTKASKHQVMADIALLTADGAICGFMKQATVTVSPNLVFEPHTELHQLGAGNL